MAKRIPALILALLFAVSLLACSGGGGGGRQDQTSTDQTASASVNQTDNEYAEIDAYVQELADGHDTSGASFTYVGRESNNFPKKDEETGDIQSDAVYFRQRDLVDIFKIDWEPVITRDGDDTKERVINEVTAGGDSFDLVYGNIITVSQHLMNAGVILRVDTMDNIDLDREWWVQSLRDTYSIKDKLFFLRGPITVESFEDPTCMLFNKKVASMFSIDESELYSLARDGKWTTEEMVRIAAYVPENTTGTGIYRYDNADSIGLLFSTGLSITHFDEDGAPTVDKALPSEIFDLSQFTVGIFADASQTPFWNHRKDETKESKYKVDKDYDWFQDNKALFAFVGTGTAIDLRKFDVTFGILPMPKGSASQANYYSYADPWGSGSCTIPKTTKSVDVTSTITEAMAALSQKYVRSAYYDMLLRGQSIFDLESRDMLDIIFATVVYDMVDLYSGGDMNQWGPLMSNLDYDMTYDNSTITSDWASNAKVTGIYIKQLVRMVDRQD